MDRLAGLLGTTIVTSPSISISPFFSCCYSFCAIAVVTQTDKIWIVFETTGIYFLIPTSCFMHYMGTSEISTRIPFCETCVDVISHFKSSFETYAFGCGKFLGEIKKNNLFIV